MLVDYFVTGAGWSIERARDGVITAWLKAGDIAPYLYFTAIGHTPSNAVARLIARMMIKGEEPGADGFEDLPFGLKLTGDMRGRPDQLAELRKFLGVRHSMTLSKGRKKSGAASYSGAADDEASDLASTVKVGKRMIATRTIRQAREQIERDLDAGRFPKILSSLISLN
ncbi:hypothetical protein [Paracoccus fontiphilus]|uniref:Uncharacterized protein n=1 Tax=Paracoccus fontiphilus TaxID=1815556 RepID=A0ABV7I9I5_9RHOB|nr:hypothetical protein [Paracoccus fontiphilus]